MKPAVVVALAAAAVVVLRRLAARSNTQIHRINQNRSRT
jgi:hypothetical protein